MKYNYMLVISCCDILLQNLASQNHNHSLCHSFVYHEVGHDLAGCLQPSASQKAAVRV